MATPLDFDFNTELQREIPIPIKVAIADVVIAWAHLDVGLTQWFGKAFGMRPFEASVAIGRMDNKTKLDKLEKLHGGRKQPRFAAHAKAISKAMRRDVGLRNAIAHHACIGVLTGDQKTAVFLTQTPDQSDPDYKQIMLHSMSQMVAATSSATQIKMDLIPIFHAFERGLDDIEDN
jgi:hypothetical protein